MDFLWIDKISDLDDHMGAINFMELNSNVCLGSLYHITLLCNDRGPTENDDRGGFLVVKGIKEHNPSEANNKEYNCVKRKHVAFYF